MVRRAEVGDAEAIARLYIASWQATYANELPADFLAGQDLSAHKAAWQSKIRQGVDVLVVEQGGALVGFVACGPPRQGQPAGAESTGGDPPAGEDREEWWQIYSIHVNPARHREGIGRVLFDGALRLGQDRGAKDLMLWVVRTNTPARAFYERRGMYLDGVEQAHTVGPGLVFDEVRYRMKLPQTQP
jgi:ribosomal protein S18 acetylase RimI-like enzyme